MYSETSKNSTTSNRRKYSLSTSTQSTQKEDEEDLCCFEACSSSSSSGASSSSMISPVESMTDAEMAIIEIAHRDSTLLELYADPSWRFYSLSRTAFCLATVAMQHGLSGDEGFWKWRRSTRGKAKIIERRPSNASDIDSISTSSSISSAQDLTITKSTRNGIKPPPPPTSVLTKDGGYEVSHMDVLSEKIWHYHNKVSQTDEMLSRKLQLRDMLYSSISPVFPMCGLYVVGSSLNGFGNNSSDMDLCLMITNKELDQKNDAVVVLNLILATLQYEKFVTSQKLILAKVPILRIKFAEPFGDITVDLNANNSVAIRNTHLLCYYSAYDWRVRPLVSVVKEWAKRKGINDANKSTFTSYSLVLMVIHYLQCGTNPVVLPNLQKLYPNRFSNKIDVRTLNVTMTLENVGTGSGGNSTTSTTTSATASNSNGNSSPMEIPAVAEDNTTLGELLIGFLDYYANQFDYDRDAISIRQGQRLERSVVARPKNMTAPPPPSQLSMNGAGICGTAVPNQQQQQTSTTTPPPSTSASTSSIQSCSKQQQVQTQAQQNQQQLFQGAWRSQWRCVCIEEPFTNSNTAHSIYDEMVFGAIKDAFREAHGELRKNHDLDRLMQCEPINVTIPATGAVVYAALYEGERPAYYGQPYQPHIQQQQQRRQPNGAQNNTYNRNGGRRYSSNQNQKSSRSQENVIVANGVEKKEDCKVRSDLTTPSPIPPASSSATSSTSVSSSNSPASTSAPNSSSSTSSNNVVVVSANK
ncbi:unnamed protein product [Caenorhabditis angaria]|uniref:polynucleotide adenylyltransferase n=1 Tax=Caenorhabditis angaria TaxID=860376 RepID=A0A9P1I6W7_9PELO|nr:unnamed protein product [Caenorhabditis angaria]